MDLREHLYDYVLQKMQDADKSPAYWRAEQELLHAGRVLLASLPPELLDLFWQYEDAMNCFQSQELRLLFAEALALGRGLRP